MERRTPRHDGRQGGRTHWFAMDGRGRVADPSAGKWKDERIPLREKRKGTGFYATSIAS